MEREKEAAARKAADEAARKEVERLAQTPISDQGPTFEGAEGSFADVGAPEEPAADHITSTEPAASGGATHS